MQFPVVRLLLIWIGCFAISFQHSPIVAQLPSTVQNTNTDKTVVGKVISRDGPVPNANVYVFRGDLLSETTTNSAGEFQIQLDSDELASILVVAKGKNCELYSLDPRKKSQIGIRLDDHFSSLTGRIIDNQGMDVADAKLRVTILRNETSTINVPVDLQTDLFHCSTTETGGFQFRGIKKTSIGSVEVSGAGIVTTSVTRDNFENEIVLVAQPARTVHGKIVDQNSRQPLSNVMVSVLNGGLTTEVDESGAFTLTGLPAFQSLLLTVDSQGEQPYLSSAELVPAELAFDPVNVEIGLEPGVWVKCNVADFTTDGPATADVFYFPTPENERFQSYVEAFVSRGAIQANSTNSKGEVKVVAIPGPGVIAIVAEGFPSNESVNALTEEQRAMLLGITGRTELTAIKWIEPKDLNDQIELNVLVSKGRAIDVEIVSSQIDASENLVVHRAASKNAGAQLVRGPKFVAEQFHPGETRQILIHSTRKGLGGILNVAADADSPVSLELEPTGSLTGRIVDKNGDPQSGLLMRFEIPGEVGYQEVATQVFTDVNGRFEKSSLIANLQYRVSAIRLTNNQQMMDGSPEMDSRWYVAEKLTINSAEEVDLGSIVLGATDQPQPKRQPRKEIVATENTLPSLIEGVVKNETGAPIVDAIITLNTWPNRSGNLQKDVELSPLVLAQSRTDSNGNFQMSVDASLEAKTVASESDGTPNIALVIAAPDMGVIQIPVNDDFDPQNIEIQMLREMIIRGRVSSQQDSPDQKVQVSLDSKIIVYDTESIKKIIRELQQGVSLETVQTKYAPVTRVDPLTGGLPLKWKVSSSGAFLIRNVPINSIFELHAFDESGQQNKLTVISRPIRGFDFKPTDDSAEMRPLQGSRVRVQLGQTANEN